ncbi:hypothetical protein G6F19_014294 [Rhizopus arrhizus]|nr:hypothetical protein G6F19_014294 [Rhizopus arrhizus]
MLRRWNLRAGNDFHITIWLGKAAGADGRLQHGDGVFGRRPVPALADHPCRAEQRRGRRRGAGRAGAGRRCQ